MKKEKIVYVLEADRVPTLFSLGRAVGREQSVIVPKSGLYKKPHTAAFVVNLPGSVILDLIRSGMYTY